MVASLSRSFFKPRSLPHMWGKLLEELHCSSGQKRGFKLRRIAAVAGWPPAALCLLGRFTLNIRTADEKGPMTNRPQPFVWPFVDVADASMTRITKWCCVRQQQWGTMRHHAQRPDFVWSKWVRIQWGLKKCTDIDFDEKWKVAIKGILHLSIVPYFLLVK